MPAKHTASFLLFGVALVLWCTGLGLSDYLADDFARNHASESGSKTSAGTEEHSSGPPRPLELSAELQALEKEAQNKPKDLDANLTFAHALMKEGMEQRDVSYLMAALQSYQTVLEIDAKHPGALLSIARLCFTQGIYDKAGEYYQRYLEIEPDDPRAQTDYAIVLAQLGEASQAKAMLTTLLAEMPDFFPGHLAMAVAHRVEGDKESAKKSALRAKELAKDDRGREIIDGFLKGLAEADAAGEITSVKKEATSDSTSNTGSGSPALTIDTFFRQHEIIGPKVTRISWPNAKTAKIELNNFPMDQMPPFVKDKLVGKIKALLEGLPNGMSVELFDVTTNKELIKISAEG